jgi:hypothetical protein
MTSSTARQAAADIALAKQVAALPGVADAHRRGEISNGQLGAVASIAQADSEQEALDMANTVTSAQLQRRAIACRGQLTEKRLAAQKGRYLAFKPEEDGQSTRLHGRLPFAEARQLESQLRRIADRVGLGDKERPSPSARMADALLILTKGNASVALHEYENSSASNNGSSSTKRVSTNHPLDGDGLANEQATRERLFLVATLEAQKRLLTMTSIPSRTTIRLMQAPSLMTCLMMLMMQRILSELGERQATLFRLQIRFTGPILG